jgi:tRNA (guanosine-2'-O-)-methyltransferase
MADDSLIAHLEQFITANRRERLLNVLRHRTAHVAVVLENVYQAHNASAVIRSCECFGIQHVHFIENRNHMRVSDEVAMGSSRWVDIHRHTAGTSNTADALNTIRNAGYRLVGVTPHENGHIPETLPISQKTALVFGTEMAGLSAEAASQCDAFLKIPMYGFTESFNVSVCAALCLYTITNRLRAEMAGAQLGDNEKKELYLKWLLADIDMSGAIVSRFLEDKKR